MACQSRTSPEVTFAACCIELFLLVAVPSHRALGRLSSSRQPPCGVRHGALSGGLWIPRAFRLPAFASWGCRRYQRKIFGKGDGDEITVGRQARLHLKKQNVMLHVTSHAERDITVLD